MGRLPSEGNLGAGPLFQQWSRWGKPRVPNARDSRVAEARGILWGPWSIWIMGLFLRPLNRNKEVVQMLLMFKECPFYRASESLSMGRGIGYCDLDCDRATCEGDQHLCEKPDALKKYLSEQKKREKGIAYFSGANRI